MNKQGFTLIELIIYVALIGGVVVALTSIALTIMQARSKAAVNQELNASARSGLEYITNAIRESDGVTLGGSVFGSDPGTLELSMPEASLDPTIFSLTADDGQLQVSENGVTTILMPTTVNVTNLEFTNLTGTGRTENIRIEITVEYNGAASQEFVASQSYQTTISVRQ